MRKISIDISLVFACLFILCLGQVSHAAESAKNTEAAGGKSALITESYYRVKWGYFDEFMDLLKKNHYPLLKEMERLGYIDSVIIDYPVNHASEDHRWDVRVTVTIPDTAKYKAEMAKVSKEIYPDQAALKKNEEQRFRLLLAHEDIMIRREDLSNW